MTDNVALTPEEQRRLKPLFEKYSMEDSSIVLGDHVRPLLEHSGLPPLQLGEIWQIVDTENRGFLDFHAFAKCARLVAHAQQGLQISPRLANIPSGMPDFNRQAAPAPGPASATSPQTTGSHPLSALAASSTGQAANSGSPRVASPQVQSPSLQRPSLTANLTGGIPPLTTADKSRFGSLFDRSIPPNSSDSRFIEGSVARDIFLKAKLPEETLGQIWALVDVDGRGKLSKNEFVVAMHLIQVTLTGALPTLPPQLPSSWQPWLGSGNGSSANVSGHQPQRSIQAQSVPAVPAQSKGPPSAPPSRSQAGTTIAPQERAQYDAIFDSLDPQKRGILGPQEAVPVLTKSNLPEDVLAKVWDLADTRSRGQLDRGDFALAMHFVKAKLNGKELPDSVSPGAGAAAASEQPQGSRQASTSGPAGVAPASAGSAPVPRAAPHASTSDSLSDLVSLDNAVFTPMEPAKPRRAQTDIDTKKFVPNTSFGQSLLRSNNPQQPGSGGQQASSPQVASPQVGSPPASSHQRDISGTAVASATAQAQVPSAGSGAEVSGPSEAEVTAQKAAAARANEELAAVLRRKAESEQKVKELRETYDAEAKQIHETQQKVKEEQEAIKQLERDLALRSSGLDAMRTQRQTEQGELDSLTARRTELEEQIKAAEAEHAEHTSAAGNFGTEKDTHQRAISEHESKVTDLRSNIEAVRARRQQLETEAQQHRERVAKAQQESEEHSRAIEQENEATRAAEAEATKHRELKEKAIAEAQRLSEERQKAHAAAQAASARAAQEASESQAAEARASEARLATSQPVTEKSAASSHPTSNVTTQSTSQTTSVPASQSKAPQQPPVENLNLAEQHTGASRSIGIPANSSSPVGTSNIGTPEAQEQYLARENSMPSFVLPMQRPMSASSSVVNNPPQSVRGDLGSEPEPDGLGQRDSFEFVDAHDHPSSDDEEGPQKATPEKFTEGEEVPPPMPGAFPTTGEPVNPLSEEKFIPEGVKQPTPVSTNVTGASSATATGASTNVTGASSTTASGASTNSGLGPGPGPGPGSSTASVKSASVPTAGIPAPATAPATAASNRNLQPPSISSSATDIPGTPPLNAPKEGSAQTGTPTLSAPTQASSPYRPAYGHQRVSSTSTSTLPEHIASGYGSNYNSPSRVPAPAPSGAPPSYVPGPYAAAAQRSIPAPPAGQYSSAQNFGASAADDFDDFDDLEEAKEDDFEPQSAPQNVLPPHIPQSHNSSATNAAPVPDEWQQLFASNPSTASVNRASVGGAQSGDVNELTSMGFSHEAAVEALGLHQNNLSEATNYLLDRS